MLKRILSAVTMLCLLLAAILYLRHQYGRSWEVLLSDCPTEITTSGVLSIGKLYLLQQTHEPLFRLADGQNYTSKVLSKWSRSADSTRYTFCPDTSLRFDPEYPLTLEIFDGYIHEVLKRFDSTAKVVRTGVCFNIMFDRPRKSFLPFLTDYAQAPTIHKNAFVDLGLGPYRVKKITASKLELLRKNPVYRGYNKIVALPYGGKKDPVLQNRDITDFNKITSLEIPSWAKTEYVGFTDITINSVFLLINHPDKEIREAVYNCMDIAALRKAFFPEKNSYYDIASVLPVGMVGAKPGKPVQACSRSKRNNERDLVYANLVTGNELQLQKFMEAFKKRTGIGVKVVNVQPAEFVSGLSKKKKQYNLTIISAGASNMASDFYLDFFGWLDYALPEGKILYEKMVREEDPEEKKKMMARIAEIFSKEKVILPLYQNEREYYYPQEIKNLVVGRSFLEFPDIGDFRW